MPLRSPRPARSPLAEALEEARLFAPARARALARDPAVLRDLAREEASFGRIALDGEGLSAGMRLHVLQPARALAGEWLEARAPFDAALKPFQPDIDAAHGLEARRTALREAAEEAVATAEAAARADRRWVLARDAQAQAQARFDERRVANANRDATLAAHLPPYWVALMLVGVAEWLINYDTFFLFTGIPAIAAGATLVLGALLAFAAHGHGTVWKQWSHRFAPARERTERHGSWRLLGLSTLALLVVLLAAGGSRYAAALRVQTAGGVPNILGAEAAVPVDPLRDVLLSLLANVGAWLLGCFLAYFAHDPDPDYMSATRQFHRRTRQFRRAARPHDDRVRTIRARLQRELSEAEVAAGTRLARVRPQAELLAQMEAHEAAVLRALAAAATANAELYRDALAAGALADRAVAVTRAAEGGAQALTPYDLRVLPVLVTPAALRGAA